MRKIARFMPATGIGLILVEIAGCAAIKPTTPLPTRTSAAAATSVPLVQNCGVLNTGTPTRFVCDGKVYTSFQLAKLREDEAAKYASRK